MSARDDGITGEVLDPAPPPPPSGVHCIDCGRELMSEPAWVGGFGDVSCIPCRELAEAAGEE